MSDFVAELEKDGFSKIQRGMYARYCTTSKNGNMHKARIATMICPRSTICLFGMADREFNEIYSHFGSTKPPKSVQAECCKNKFICFYC
ncbi:MAG: hypothetical protein MJY99_08440 [Fibrobacter sp.]|nr:hypothetical protein [Fibrobacter sp.]